jgi:hypothetical protein
MSTVKELRRPLRPYRFLRPKSLHLRLKEEAYDCLHSRHVAVSDLDRAIHEQDAESEPSESLSDSGVHEVDTEQEPTKNIELLAGSDENLHAPLADSIHKAADKSLSEGVEKEQNSIVTAEVPEPAKIDEDVAG